MQELAAHLNTTPDAIEDSMTLDQIRLRYHFLLRRTFRHMEWNHKMIRAAVAEGVRGQV